MSLTAIQIRDESPSWLVYLPSSSVCDGERVWERGVESGGGSLLDCVISSTATKLHIDGGTDVFKQTFADILYSCSCGFFCFLYVHAMIRSSVCLVDDCWSSWGTEFLEKYCMTPTRFCAKSIAVLHMASYI